MPRSPLQCSVEKYLGLFRICVNNKNRDFLDTGTLANTVKAGVLRKYTFLTGARHDPGAEAPGGPIFTRKNAPGKRSGPVSQPLAWFQQGIAGKGKNRVPVGLTLNSDANGHLKHNFYLIFGTMFVPVIF